MKKITMQPDGTSLQESFDSFIMECQVRNLSAQTIGIYKTHYRIFMAFYAIDNLEGITENTINQFVLHLRNNTKCNDITINSYLRSIRVFVNWLIAGEAIKPFPFPIRKVDKPLKQTYTESELRILLKKPSIKECSFTEYKTWVFSNFLLGTGMRITSAINVKILEVDFDNMCISVNVAKGRKATLIPLSTSLSAVLQEYLRIRKGKPEDYLFCNSYGLKADKRTYQTMLSTYNKSRGVQKTSAHLYRHTFAKNWILNGGDIFRLQKILMHFDISMVKEYVAMFSNDVAQDFDRFNPLDSLRMGEAKERIRMK